MKALIIAVPLVNAAILHLWTQTDPSRGSTNDVQLPFAFAPFPRTTHEFPEPTDELNIFFIPNTEDVDILSGLVFRGEWEWDVVEWP
jgi:hypothetical protein